MSKLPRTRQTDEQLSLDFGGDHTLAEMQAGYNVTPPPDFNFGRTLVSATVAESPTQEIAKLPEPERTERMSDALVLLAGNLSDTTWQFVEAVASLKLLDRHVRLRAEVEALQLMAVQLWTRQQELATEIGSIRSEIYWRPTP